MCTLRRPRRGLAAVRYAVAGVAGWEWCAQHQRSRWDGPDTCRLRHRPLPEDRLAVCGTCEHRHGPMDWGDGCEPLGEAWELAA